MAINPGTTVVYNGVTLSNVITREFDSETIYDPSGTDMIARKVRFTFAGVLHSQNVTTAPTSITFGTVGHTEAVPKKALWLQELLSVPRQVLIVQNSNVEFFRCTPTTTNNLKDADNDTDNGPKPTRVQVTHIAGDKVFRVTFSIECTFANCVYLSGTKLEKTRSTPVINNRWSIREAMNDNYFTTRTISGHIRLSHALSSAHAYKALCVPPLEDGFKRESIEFEELPNGLEANYNVTDKQVHTSAPWPLTKFTARHEESTTEALEMNSSMAVSCWGDPSTSKADMLVRAVQIADARLQFSSSKRDNFHYTHVGIIDEVGEENRLDLNITIRRYDAEQRTIFDLMATSIGKTLVLPALPNAKSDEGKAAYNPQRSRRPALWGYDGTKARNPAQMFLLHCYLQSPCSINKGMWQGAESVKEVEPQPTAPSNATSVSGSVVDSLSPPPPADGYAKEHSEAIYTMARMTSRYTNSVIRAHMPLAYSANSDTAAYATLSGGLCRRIIKVDCERVGKQPQIPVPIDSYDDPNGMLKGRLLEHWVEGSPPTLAPTGDKKIFRVTAYYVYGMNRPPAQDTKLAMGVLPFTSFAKVDTALNLADTYSDTVGP